MSAELTHDEADAQLAMWSTKFSEATNERDRLDRLAQGYSRMIEGLKLIYPELADEPAQERPHPETADGTAATPGVVPQSGPTTRTEDAVMAIINSADEDVEFTVREIDQAIKARGWRLDSEKPENPIRKFLAQAREDGKVLSRQIDGRTIGYRRKPDMTPGADVVASTPGPVTPQGSGGDSDEPTPPGTAVSEDHDPTSG